VSLATAPTEELAPGPPATIRPPARRLPAIFLIAALGVWAASALWVGNPVTVDTVLVTLITGVSLGSIYAMAASGLVVTYTATGIFNFAQGAIGMLMAFIFWQLTVDWGIPTLAGVLLTVLVAAPLFGMALEALLMRHLVQAALVVQLVVTIGLMLGLMGVAQTIWDPREGRSVEFFFGFEGFTVGDTVVLWHRALAVAVAAFFAVGLRVLLRRTRLGVTMRAVVDNRTLAALHGARPRRVSLLAWALASSTAALAGILLVPEVGLSVEPLTFLTVSAFAAAIVGRLRNLPMTFVGAMVLGIMLTFTRNFLDVSGRWAELPNAIPSLFLLAALLALPQARVQLGRMATTGLPGRVTAAPVRHVAIGMVILLVAVVVVSAGADVVNLNRLTLAIVTAALLLSYVPLTGWSGQVSLAQITFAGIGAFTMWKVAGESGNPLGLLAAAAVAAPFGCLMALPALRLHGLYLALASLAFALVGQYLLFAQSEVFGVAGRSVTRPEFLGLDLADQRTFLLFATVCFAVLGLGVAALRRSRLGRRLVALRDSEAACVTLGVNPIVTKLVVYGLSAALAGFAGGLLIMQRTTSTAAEFTMLMGIPLLLLVVVGGVEKVSGALIGGALSVFLIFAQATWDISLLRSIEILGPALMAISVARNPDGMSADIAKVVGRLRRRVGGGRSAPPGSPPTAPPPGPSGTAGSPSGESTEASSPVGAPAAPSPVAAEG
jgi:branched-chain amino acid transport system permease protein